MGIFTFDNCRIMICICKDQKGLILKFQHNDEPASILDLLIDSLKVLWFFRSQAME
jgi:hypothetical protein